MKFSTRDRYALRLMVELANRPNDLIPLKDISDKQRISLKYLEQIVTPLAKAGLVSSVMPSTYLLIRSFSPDQKSSVWTGCGGGSPPTTPNTGWPSAHPRRRAGSRRR